MIITNRINKSNILVNADIEKYISEYLANIYLTKYNAWTDNIGSADNTMESLNNLGKLDFFCQPAKHQKSEGSNITPAFAITIINVTENADAIIHL